MSHHYPMRGYHVVLLGLLFWLPVVGVVWLLWLLWF
jgi:hypothetical protein